MDADTLNEVRWDGNTSGFYEVWYLTLIDPASQDAYWLRYTVEAFSGGDTEAGLWAISSPGKDARTGLALHDRLGGDKFSNKTTEEKGFRLEVAKSFLEKGRAKGECGKGDKRIEWDLKWTPSLSFEHVPAALETMGIAKSAINSPNLACLMDGTIKVGGKSIKVAQWPGHQSHTWGKKHAYAWAWAHCNAFPGDATAVFEGCSARIKKLGMVMPAASPLLVRFTGPDGLEEHDWGGVLSMWSVTSQWDSLKWQFEADAAGILVRGTVSAPAERFIAVEYKDPDGDLLYCNHATQGDLSIEIYRRVGARWQQERTLESKGTTAFEIMSRDRIGGAGRQLDLVDARWADEPKVAAV